MGETKVRRFGLTSMAIDLMDQGLKEDDIAQHLTEYCEEHGIKDGQGRKVTISQSTVNRELKPIREKFRNEAKGKINKHINDHIEGDLETIEEAERYHLAVARDEGQKHGIRSDAYVKTCRLIFEKIKSAMGGPSDEDIADQVVRSVRSELEQIDPKLRGKLNAVCPTPGPESVRRDH